MSTLLVLAFATETGAQEMVGRVQTLQRQQLIVVSDAATVVRHRDGMVKVKQVNNMVGAGALGGAFWGLLIGLLFWQPWLGMAVGAATGAVAGKVKDNGIDDHFIEDVSNCIELGHSALFMIVALMTEDKVLPVFAELNATLLRSNLSPTDEIKLCAAFGVIDEGV